MSMLRMPCVKRETGHRSDASIYKAIRDGLFTSGVAIGVRARAWPDTEVWAINAARIAGRSDSEVRELVVKLHALRTEALRDVGL
jgi:prophage regulatory protein